EDGIRDDLVTGVQTCLFRSDLRGLAFMHAFDAHAESRVGPRLPAALDAAPRRFERHQFLPFRRWRGRLASVSRAKSHSRAGTSKIGRASCRERVWCAVGAGW